MAVNWDSLPPALTMDAASRNDYRAAAQGQTFFGLVNVATGVVYLVPGEPTVVNRGWIRNTTPQFSRVTVNSHIFALAPCNLIGAHHPKCDVAGFSITKGANGAVHEIRVRSSLNDEAFANQPPGNADGGEDRASRVMPGPWATALSQLLNTAL